MKQLMDDCAPTMEAFVAVTGTVTDSSVYNPVWIQKAKDVTEQMVDTCSMIGTMSEIPPSLKTSDEYMKKAAAEMIQIKIDFFDGLDNLNVSSFNKATEHINMYFGYITLATKSLPNYE
jgi:hypothetical protein